MLAYSSKIKFATVMAELMIKSLMCLLNSIYWAMNFLIKTWSSSVNMSSVTCFVMVIVQVSYQGNTDASANGLK